MVSAAFPYQKQRRAAADWMRTRADGAMQPRCQEQQDGDE